MSRLVLLHGFTQTGGSWATVELEAVRPDLPPLPLWDAAAAIAPLGPATFVGYSMGGRIALHLALAHRPAVERLVLVSTTAGIDDADERAARRAADDALADRAEAIGAEAFVREWLAQPMFAGVPPVARSTDAAAMAKALRLAGTGTQEPLWARLGELTMPVLVVAGERDAKYVALAERLVEGLPDADLAVVAGAGHAVPFEQPRQFAALVTAFTSSS
jgi:2-succinyl-6-hydroxy-2,4-cyclohexadiene-1-carboxylate synthase